MKKKQKKQAELLEKRIQEIEGGALPDGGEEEDDEETEANEDASSSTTLPVSATLQDFANQSSTGEWVDPGPIYNTTQHKTFRDEFFFFLSFPENSHILKNTDKTSTLPVWKPLPFNSYSVHISKLETVFILKKVN